MAVSEPLECDAVSGRLRTAAGPAELLLESSAGHLGTIGCYFFFRLWISSQSLEQLNCANFMLVKSLSEFDLVITEL